MKRLLEWKQRMLQSPLNRKVQGNRVYAGRNVDYYNENGYIPQKHSDSCSDGRRSVTNLPQYNSYSSDDEGECLSNSIFFSFSLEQLRILLCFLYLWVKILGCLDLYLDGESIGSSLHWSFLPGTTWVSTFCN